MTTIQPNYSAITPDRQNVIGCHNLASARAYASGRVPVSDTSPVQRTYPVKAFVSPSGQYYVQTASGLRMDVANASTARRYARDGVSLYLLTTSFDAKQ